MISRQEIQTLRQSLSAAGVFQRCEASGWRKLFLLLGITGAALVGVVFLPLVWSVVLLPVAAIAIATAAMLGHEGCHRSFSDSRWQNELLAHMTFPLLSGLSSLYWKHKHNGLHHGHPNVAARDPDVDLWPMAACRADYEASGVARQFFQRHLQGYCFWPLTTLMPTIMRIPSIQFLARYRKERGVDRGFFCDAACMVAHYALWLVVPALIWGPLPTLALYMVLWGLVGVILALIFAPAHLGLPIVEGQNNDWLHQLETTRNLSTGWLSWFFVGLDYQIEHHLFPKIAHQNMKRAAVIVEAWCARLGVPYRRIGYREALRSVTRYIADAWHTDAVDKDELRSSFAPRSEAKEGVVH